MSDPEKAPRDELEAYKTELEKCRRQQLDLAAQIVAQRKYQLAEVVGKRIDRVVLMAGIVFLAWLLRDAIAGLPGKTTRVIVEGLGSANSLNLVALAVTIGVSALCLALWVLTRKARKHRNVARSMYTRHLQVVEGLLEAVGAPGQEALKLLRSIRRELDDGWSDDA